MTRVAVVTGGSSGIGLVCAEALMAAGYQVAVGARRGTGPDGAFTERLDVTDPLDVDVFCTKVNQSLGPPTLLINAAGLYCEAALTDADTAHWHDQIAVNLTGPFLMTRALMPGMVAAGFGRIVNIASTAGSTGAAGYAGYCASKAGLIGLTKATAQEGAPNGITAVSISPTWVDTPMLKAAAERLQPAAPEAFLEGVAQENPQNRIVQAEEIANLVVFCCSASCPALTGEDILVTAGASW